VTPVTVPDLLRLLLADARRFRLDANASLARNAHMHGHRGGPLDQAAIDAVLVLYLNAVAGRQGCDWALHASDLAAEAPGAEPPPAGQPPPFAADFSPDHPTNRAAADHRGLRYDPERRAYLDADGYLIRDRFGQPY
jgi:hypothetical protein